MPMPCRAGVVRARQVTVAAGFPVVERQLDVPLERVPGNPFERRELLHTQQLLRVVTPVAQVAALLDVPVVSNVVSIERDGDA